VGSALIPASQIDLLFRIFENFCRALFEGPWEFHFVVDEKNLQQTLLGDNYNIRARFSIIPFLMATGE